MSWPTPAGEKLKPNHYSTAHSPTDSGFQAQQSSSYMLSRGWIGTLKLLAGGPFRHDRHKKIFSCSVTITKQITKMLLQALVLL